MMESIHVFLCGGSVERNVVAYMPQVHIVPPHSDVRVLSFGFGFHGMLGWFVCLEFALLGEVP